MPRNLTNHGGGDFDTKNGCKVLLKMGFNQGNKGISMDFLHSGGWNQSNRGFRFECAKTGESAGFGLVRKWENDDTPVNQGSLGSGVPYFQSNPCSYMRR